MKNSRSMRALIVAASALSLSGIASAEMLLRYTPDGASAKSATLTSVSLNINRSPQFDPETGEIIADAPHTVNMGAVYVSRKFDASSVDFIRATTSGESLGDVSLVLDGGATWNLRGVRISSYSTYGNETDGQTENFDLSFDEAKLNLGGQVVDLTPSQ